MLARHVTSVTVLLSLSGGGTGAAAGHQYGRPQGQVALTYLANMGVHLASQGATVVIDGLHRGALPDYASLLPDASRALEAAMRPYERIDVMLATHRHLDHFDAMAVGARMRADTHVVFAAPAETIDSLLANVPALRGNTRVIAMRGGDSLQVGAVRVHAVDLPHNATPTRRAENLGYVVTLGGLRILHVGDADPSVTTYASRRLAALQLDAAIVPFWYVWRRRSPVLDAIGASCYIASHVPLRDTMEVLPAQRGSDAVVKVLASRGARFSLTRVGAEPEDRPPGTRSLPTSCQLFRR